MASKDAVFLRRNKQIQDAIDGQNLKQALNLIEKRMKKGENTVFLKVHPLVPCRACCIRPSVPFRDQPLYLAVRNSTN